ncbi:MAG: response regulator transcription factor [Verrucomicrobiota bacterium]
MKKILVIEDDATMRQNIVTILQMEDFTVLTATNGQAGIALAQEQKPDLILCDIMLPKADGHEVLRQLRAATGTASIPVIFLTAKTDAADRRAGMNQGADDYLTKPITVPELLAAIEARLRRRQELTSFQPSFDSAKPLESLGLTPREAEVLFWVAQGKMNAEIALILDMSVGTVKKHMEHLLPKMNVENRATAIVRALEILSRSR